MDANAMRPRALGLASAVLWALAAVLAAAAVVKVAMYGRFANVSAEACGDVMDLEPPGGWSDRSFPCEQLGPMGWYLPYWVSLLAYVVFAVLFLVAAILAARTATTARGFTLWTAIVAVALCAVPGLLNLGRRFAEAGANQADTLVAARVFDAFPGWVEAVETVVQVLLVVGAAAAVWLLSRPEVRAALERR
ncbi:hypothetical protein [Glycomyces algeriensis]|uniref:Uncharacterized protein n=1 Tax=Glycomyces algeriensis TaxID=256037 RepID=A0A9W6GB03_9ACTN|nr:hypothetical protein [Glycomyces algeriensis]MDA1364722.1 hypothetical protein [Glycomyces algeriensis]MDR7350763.1 uncharacterized membrane protein YhaH (DUF805 family) [Glycomyces algeriensis]GLI43473.1 hypothetical protein GALLR39Z86_33230 [Glycomyces algeriensis]